MRGIVKSMRGFGLAALVASAPAGAQVTLNASSWVPPGHPITATMLAPLCADIEKGRGEPRAVCVRLRRQLAHLLHRRVARGEQVLHARRGRRFAGDSGSGGKIEHLACDSHSYPWGASAAQGKSDQAHARVR